MTPIPNADQAVNSLVTARNSSGPRTVGAAGDLAEPEWRSDMTNGTGCPRTPCGGESVAVLVDDGCRVVMHADGELAWVSSQGLGEPVAEFRMEPGEEECVRRLLPHRVREAALEARLRYGRAFTGELAQGGAS